MKFFQRLQQAWFGRPLSCEDVNRFIIDYLEESIPASTQRQFEDHVSRCPNCSAYLEQYKQTIELVREQGALDPDPPPELVELTLTFLRQHVEK